MKKLMYAVLFSMGLVISSCSSDDQDKVTSCADRIEQSLDASLALIDATDDTFTVLCTQYRAALQLQIDSCGDENGVIQAVIDDLEDCSIAVSTGD